MLREQIPDLSRTEWVRLIDEWIFSERDRAILKRRLLDGIIYEDLAEEFDMSPNHIKVIVYRGTERITKHLDKYTLV